MDPYKLPERCLIDTGIVIRALRQTQDDRTQICCDFWDAMIENKRTMLIAAPTLAEILRKEPTTTLPSTASVEVVAFDRRAATVLGEKITFNIIEHEHKTTGYRMQYLKYDAMIVACAKRHDAKTIIALDSDHPRLAKYVSVPVKKPGDFEWSDDLFSAAGIALDATE